MRLLIIWRGGGSIWWLRLYQHSRPQTLPLYTVQIMNVEMIRYIKFSKTLAVAPRQTLAQLQGTCTLTYVHTRNQLESSGKFTSSPAGCSSWTTSALTRGKNNVFRNMHNLRIWPLYGQIWQKPGREGSDRRVEPCLHLGSRWAWAQSNSAIPQPSETQINTHTLSSHPNACTPHMHTYMHTNSHSQTPADQGGRG